MKKIIALISSLAICLSFVSCKGNDTKSSSSSKAPESSAVTSAVDEVSSKEDSSENTSSSSDITESIADNESKESAESSKEDSSKAVTLNIKSIQDFIDMNETTFESLKKSIEGSGLTIDIVARENSLVYSYKYDEEVDSKSTKKTLDSTMKGQEDTFKQVYDSVKSIVPSAESVIVEYLEPNGDLVASYEFK